MGKIERINQLKTEIEEQIGLPGGKFRNLSAQDFLNMSEEKRAALKLVIEASGVSYDKYEEGMKALFPAEFIPKPLKWRSHGEL